MEILSGIKSQQTRPVTSTASARSCGRRAATAWSLRCTSGPGTSGRRLFRLIRHPEFRVAPALEDNLVVRQPLVSDGNGVRLEVHVRILVRVRPDHAVTVVRELDGFSQFRGRLGPAAAVLHHTGGEPLRLDRENAIVPVAIGLHTGYAARVLELPAVEQHTARRALRAVAQEDSDVLVRHDRNARGVGHDGPTTTAAAATAATAAACGADRIAARNVSTLRSNVIGRRNPAWGRSAKAVKGLRLGNDLGRILGLQLRNWEGVRDSSPGA